MEKMIPKQIMLSEQQDTWLKRIARERGVSEEALIEQAIEALVQQDAKHSEADAAWESAYTFMLSLQANTSGEPQPRTWQREDLYDERLKRYEQNSD